GGVSQSRRRSLRGARRVPHRPRPQPSPGLHGRQALLPWGLPVPNGDPPGVRVPAHPRRVDPPARPPNSQTDQPDRRIRKRPGRTPGWLITRWADGMKLDLARARADTPGVNRIAHLNNAGASLAPKPVIDAVVGHVRLESEMGPYEAAERAQEAIER